MIAIFADLPNLLPGAMGFRVYHLKHHSHQGDYEYDADLASQWEAELVGESMVCQSALASALSRRAINPAAADKSLSDCGAAGFSSTSSALSPMMPRSFISAAGLDLFYLLLSFCFSIGLHPVGARWIQEHYTNDPEQETYSYYGPINRICLNMGYHNEHHDFPTIPWNNLPKLRALAPEYLRHSEMSPFLERSALPVHFRSAIHFVLPGRAHERSRA